MDKSYTGPTLELDDDGKYKMTSQFIQDMIEWFKSGKNLPRRYVWEIVLGAHGYFAAEDSLVSVEVKDGMTCDVIGDVHGTPSACLCPSLIQLLLGQFYDLLNLYSLTGEPSDSHCLLMNGDLVDRGSWSVEVILTAFAYKCLFSHLLPFRRLIANRVMA